MDLAVTLGMRLRLLRTALDVEAGALAKRAGVARNTISNIENDRFGGRASTLGYLAKALGVAPRALEDDATFARELFRILGLGAEALGYREPPETSTTYREPPETSTTYREPPETATTYREGDELERRIESTVRRVLEQVLKERGK